MNSKVLESLDNRKFVKIILNNIECRKKYSEQLAK